MKNVLLFIAFTLISATTFAASPGVPSSFHDWARLGVKKVNFKIDRDVIKVGLKKGKFKKLKIQVTGGSLNMHRMVVEYGNGEKETIQLKDTFKKGAGSRIIDLNGGGRVIKDITFWYDSKNNRARKATVHIFGKH